MSAGAEGHELIGIANVRTPVVVLALQPRHIHQQLFRRRLARQRRHVRLLFHIDSHE